MGNKGIDGKLTTTNFRIEFRLPQKLGFVAYGRIEFGTQNQFFCKYPNIKVYGGITVDEEKRTFGEGGRGSKHILSLILPNPYFNQL